MTYSSTHLRDMPGGPGHAVVLHARFSYWYRETCAMTWRVLAELVGRQITTYEHPFGIRRETRRSRDTETKGER
jgi:hypothetical protein